jgi:hypothetical protein
LAYPTHHRRQESELQQLSDRNVRFGAVLFFLALIVYASLGFFIG